jgi:hypothetical protein
MSNRHGEGYVPFYTRGKSLQVRTVEELKRLILDTDDVKNAIATMVRERTEQYKHHY